MKQEKYMVEMKSSLATAKGFTIIELLMGLAVVAIVSTMAIDLLTGSVEEERFTETVNEMKNIRDALIGNPDALDLGSRTRFGYLGDVGDLPTTAQGLAALLTLPTGVSSYAFSSTANYGIGWNGPYVQVSDPGTSIINDAFGTAYVYTNDGINPPTLVSRGADATAGGTGLDQDITITLSTELTFATVDGYILNNGAPFSGTATIELYQPDGDGDLLTDSVSIDSTSSGHFQFTSVPFGIRSVKVSIPDNTNPSAVIGPALVMVDKPQVMINSDSFDVGASNNSNGGDCTAGLVTAVTGLSFPNNREPRFSVDIEQAVDVTRIEVGSDVGGNPELERIVLQGTTYQCTGSNTFVPCTAEENEVSEMYPPHSLVAASSVTFDLEFDTNMNGVGSGTFYLKLFYDKIGLCDEIRI